MRFITVLTQNTEHLKGDGNKKWVGICQIFVDGNPGGCSLTIHTSYFDQRGQVMAAMLQPVFWDPTGRRPYRVAYVAITVALLVVAIGVFEWRSVFAPLDEPALNKAADYPRSALEIERGKTMAVIGDTETGILNRVVRIDRRRDATYIVDPYTAQVIRTVTDADLEQIGSHSYAVDYFGKPVADKQLMLTFDDGPDARFTPQILDVLVREGVTATFFVLGESVTKNPEVLQRIIREGHMVGNHTMTHHDFDGQSNWRNRSELLLTSRLIRAAGHYDTSLFRIPRADPDNNSLALLQAQQQGLVHVNLDVDTLDWSYKPGGSGACATSRRSWARGAHA